MAMTTQRLSRCIETLRASTRMFGQAATDSTEQEVFRHAVVKGFELVQETSFRLLKEGLVEFGYTSRRLEQTPVKELLRLAAQHGLMTLEEVERWFEYGDARNSTAHEYGEAFVLHTMAMMAAFLEDCASLEIRFRQHFEAVGSCA